MKQEPYDHTPFKMRENNKVMMMNIHVLEASIVRSIITLPYDDKKTTTLKGKERKDKVTNTYIYTTTRNYEERKIKTRNRVSKIKFNV